VHLLDAALGLLALQANQFQQAHLRNRIAITGAGHGQGRNDRQGQGDLHFDGRSPSRPTLDRDRAANLLDVSAYHVHADAPAGELGHPVGRGETR
jgi:hypothetical protein